MLEQLSPRLKLVLTTGILLLAVVYFSNPLTAPPSLALKLTHGYTYPAEPHAHVLNTTAKRVAVIGAGASGSSAAWFLTRAADVVAARLGVERHALLDEIVVFEKNKYIGGRTTTVHPHGDQRLRPVELGGSIFVEANRHMNKGAKRFGLRVVDPDFGDKGVGIWDGAQFLFTTSTSKSWWSGWTDTLAAIRRYGPTSPYRTTRAVKALLRRFADLYDPAWLAEHGAAASVDEFAERVHLGREYTTRRGDEWAMTAVGVGERWMGEIWEASTRTNYAMDMHDIHALGAAVSMATGGAKSVEGGNWRIFEAMLDEAKASLRLNTPVVDIVPLAETDETRPTRFQVHTNDSTDNGVFDQIFFAAPWHAPTPGNNVTGLPTLQKHLTHPIRPTEYVHLHVTLLTTTRTGPDPGYFHLPSTTQLPSTILTTSATWRAQPDDPVPRPEFQSISWHGETSPGSGEYVVKIFSLTPVTDSWLYQLLGEDPSWIVRKQWDSYPALRPLSTYPPVEPVKGVQYLAAFEPWVSTMETQTLSAREAVARVVEDWWNLGYGECEAGADAWDWSCEQ